MKKHLVLFDIDGTLLLCGPQVRPIFLGSLKEVFGGHGDAHGYDFSGKTDPQITLELVRLAGRRDDEILALLPAMRRVYLRRLESELRRERMRLLPGVVALLERLSARGDVLLGLLTGNWRHGAEVKLSRFDLGRFFAIAAFGDDAIERRRLVPVALERAAEHNGRRIAAGQTLIVGDSVLDVDCARAAGVPSLAVATGFTAADRLQTAGADWVFSDLEQASREFELFQERS